MPCPYDSAMTSDRPVITRSRLVTDLRALGVEAGQVVMLHVSVKAIGWVVGGPDVVLDALLEVLTPDGTLMMYVAWEGDAYEMDTEDWPEARKQACLAEHPPFDAARSRAYRKWSILTEYLRTRPGAHRSANPECSMAAVGAQAEWLTRDHPLQHGAGPGSPLEKLVQAGGKVLLLGSPTSDVTVLHYAEYLADVPDKRTVRYRAPLLREGQREWVWVEELDGNKGIADWPGEEYFSPIVQGYLDSGRGRAGKVGAAESYLLEAPEVVDFAARWMEREFGERAR
jgi:aminoglycoside 3-N-acetyltransferase